MKILATPFNSLNIYYCTPNYFLPDFKEVPSTILAKSGGICPHTPCGDATSTDARNAVTFGIYCKLLLAVKVKGRKQIEVQCIMFIPFKSSYFSIVCSGLIVRTLECQIFLERKGRQ